MSANDVEMEGESDVFGLPTQIGPWQMQSESMAEIVWRRDTGETDRDPEDGQEKPLYEYVVVKIGPHGGSWRGQLRKGFADTTLLDRPQLTQFEQASRTDEGRSQVLDAAIDFMIERVSEDLQEPVGGITDDEERLIEEILAEEDADDIAGWHRVGTVRGQPRRGNKLLLQWWNDDETIKVNFEYAEDTDDDGNRVIRWYSIMLGSDDISGVSTTYIKSRADDLEGALDGTIGFLRSHDPNAVYPIFSATMEGGILLPIVNALRRHTGKVLVEVTSDAIHIDGATFSSTVELRIGRGSMERFDVQREGEIAVDSDDWWDAVSDFNYSDTVTFETQEYEGEYRRFAAGKDTWFASHPVSARRRQLPEPFPFDARFAISGLEYRDVTLAVRHGSGDVAAFGVHEGVPIFVSEDRSEFPGDGSGTFASSEPIDTVRARFDPIEVEGEGVVAISPSWLHQLRQSIPRPSQTNVEFTIVRETPLLAEYSIDGIDVDVRIALEDVQKIDDFDLAIPVEEITVPEGPPPEDVEDETEEALERAIEEVMGPEDEDDEDLLRRPISVVRTTSGLSYGLPTGEASIGVDEEVADATRAEIGHASQFDEGQRVGTAFLTDVDISTQRSLDHIDIHRTPTHPDIDVGDFAIVEWRTDGNEKKSEVWGDVTNVEGDQFTVKVGDSRTIVNTETDRVSVPATNTEGDLLNIEIENSLAAINETGIGWDDDRFENLRVEFEEDTLAQTLAAMGINEIVARHLGREFESVDEVHAALDQADDPTDIPGITEKVLEDAREGLTAAGRQAPEPGGVPEAAGEPTEPTEPFDRPVLRASSVSKPEPSLIAINSEYAPTRSVGDWLWDDVEEFYGITEIEDLIRATINPGDDYRTMPDAEAVEDKGRELLRTWIIKNTDLRAEAARPLSQWFDDPADVIPGLEAMDDYTQIPGVGEAIAADIRAVIDGEGVEKEAVEVGEEEAPPPPPDEPEEEATTQTILVSLIGGSKNYNVPGRVPGAVQDEAISAARDTLGPPGEFDVNDTVGEVTFRGSSVSEIDLEDGRKLLGMAGDEPPDGGGQPPGDGDEDTIELPVSVDDFFENGKIYTVPPNTVPLPTAEAIDDAFHDAIGPADDYQNGLDVGVALVTAAANPSDRRLVDIDPRDEFTDDEPEPEPDPEPDPVEEPDRLSAGQVETIIEQATVGVNVDLPREDVQQLHELRLEPVRGEGIRFRQNPNRITASVGETVGETIRHAIERWREFAVVDELDEDEIGDINQRRRRLADEFNIEIPLIEVGGRDIPPADAIEVWLNRATAGVISDVSISEAADSIRIAFEPDPTSDVVISGRFDEIQGQASRPARAITDALEEWEANVDLNSVDLDQVNAERNRLERDTDFAFEAVSPVDEAELPDIEGIDALQKWQEVKRGFDLTEIDESVLTQQEGMSLPVEIEQDIAEMIEEGTRAEFEPQDVLSSGDMGQQLLESRAMEGIKQVSKGLQVHLKESVREEVHAVIAEMLDTEPESLYDATKPSDLAGYDRFWTFTLTREEDTDPWTVPRFKPSDLLEALEPHDHERIHIVALAAPLE